MSCLTWLWFELGRLTLNKGEIQITSTVVWLTGGVDRVGGREIRLCQTKIEILPSGTVSMSSSIRHSSHAKPMGTHGIENLSDSSISMLDMGIRGDTHNQLLLIQFDFPFFSIIPTTVITKLFTHVIANNWRFCRNILERHLSTLEPQKLSCSTRHFAAPSMHLRARLTISLCRRRQTTIS